MKVGDCTKIHAVRKCGSMEVFHVKYANGWDCFDREERINETQKRGEAGKKT